MIPMSDSKIAMYDSQQYPWNLYLINNIEHIVAFRFDNSNLFSYSRNAQFTVAEKQQVKIISIQNYKHWHLKGTVVNRALSS